ncbi:hypothetical protein [Pseudarthrobacter sp. B4EP4b]|uniref:hypothetical protein n=1 Tax=Pseudarthrobacter sp. B4EP4b TaxID=2590664 RepID=UPI0015EFA4A0|nr:hypothetical protein [Pseudarthrobacter sp. B4EP4b]
MEAIGERPEQYGGNVVVLGRAGVTTPGTPSGFNGPVAVGSGSFTASSPHANADYDGIPLSPGWPLHAVPSEPTPADGEPAASADTDSAPTGPAEAASALTGPATGPVPADSSPAGEPLGLAELGRLVAQAAAVAPSILAGASYLEAATYAGDVENLSRTMEYLQVLSAGTVDRTRTQAIAAADTARANRSRTGTGKGWVTGWVTGWDNGIETLNETDAHWPAGSAPCDTGTMSVTDGRNRVITSPADDGCANTAEFLRQRLRISKSEANRRLALAKDILPASTLTGDTIPAPRQHLATALTPHSPTPARTLPTPRTAPAPTTALAPAARTPGAPATDCRAQPLPARRSRPGPGRSSP